MTYQCKTTEDLLNAIKSNMVLNKISQKELASTLHKPSQSVSQFFNYGKPKADTIFEYLDAMGYYMEITFVKK